MALAAVVAAALLAPAVSAEEGMKALPTLLIKGEVVSLDTTDPSANLLKVKDRYGFETPIILTQDTKITQGEAPAGASALNAGTAVEVEYNFDVNTAKRHAVTVKVSTPSATAAAPMQPAPAGTTAPAAAPAAPEAPAAIEAPPAQPALESGTPAEAPASPEQPAPATP
jgi:hypothetical protein